MKSVGIITFHASHNYGSMLQAYALQQTVIGLGYKCEIINLRPTSQRMMYRPFYRQHGWIKKIKALVYPKLAFNDMRKHRLFERFISDNFILSEKEYGSTEELIQDAPVYDVYISGSDQIWNTSCCDFEKAYYLNFVKDGKRVAYAPSMGPKATSEVRKEFFSFIMENIENYDILSVREVGTAEHVKKITGKDLPIYLDPTFLPDKSIWMEMAGEKPIIKGDYILLYTPYYIEGVYEEANKLSERLGIKIITTLYFEMHRWRKTGNFKAFLNVGPVEFLNLVKNARMVISGSFHAVVFSLIFGRPFCAVGGLNDNRISPLLKYIGLEELAQSSLEAIPEYNSESAWSSLDSLRRSSLEFLTNALS